MTGSFRYQLRIRTDSIGGGGGAASAPCYEYETRMASDRDRQTHDRRRAIPRVIPSKQTDVTLDPAVSRVSGL